MATLVEIREQFIRHSGRYDLVTDNTTWADNGADWYIRAGQRMLDGMVGQPLEEARRFQVVQPGVFTVSFEGCRSIKEVWAATETESWQLTWYEPMEFRQLFAEPWGSATSGTPTAWTLGRIRSVPDGSVVDKFNNFAGDLLSDPTNSTGIVWQPPTDTELQIEVVGTFSTMTLTNDTDKNFWSVRHEDLLVLAALYKLETMLGNAERQRDWYEEIKQRTFEIEKDMIETEVNQVWELRG